MKRCHDWPEKLAAFIESRRHKPFAWGSNDCCMFPADGVAAITEPAIDLAAAWRGKYGDDFGAVRLIAEAGGLRGFARHHQLVEVRWQASARGNVVLAEHGGRETFGLDAGNGYWCAPGEHRLEFRPMREVLASYAI
jgi:hypothetical protein